jgi:hypothetical protein
MMCETDAGRIISTTSSTHLLENPEQLANHMAAPPTPRTAAALKEAESLEARAAIAERTAVANARIRKAEEAAFELTSPPPRGQGGDGDARGGGGGGGGGGGAPTASAGANKQRRKSPPLKVAEVSEFPSPISAKGKFGINSDGGTLVAYQRVTIDGTDQVAFDGMEVIGDLRAVGKAMATCIKRACTAVQALSFLRTVMRDLKETVHGGESESGELLPLGDKDIGKIASTASITIIDKRVSEFMTGRGIDPRLFSGQYFMPLLELVCRYLLLKDDEIEEVTPIALGYVCTDRQPAIRRSLRHRHLPHVSGHHLCHQVVGRATRSQR